MLFKASAPGSLMLLGEYAVLQGKKALVCAVNRRMHVSIQPRTDQLIHIVSALGEVSVNLKLMKAISPFQFILATLIRFRQQLPSGCDITIEAEFSDQVGFASSAAVTVALLKALDAWLSLSWTELQLIREAKGIVRKVQGLGSGADVAACVLGGVVSYQSQPLMAERLSHQTEITAVYSGSKTPTVVAVKKVQQLQQQNPKLVNTIMQAIGQCAEQGAISVREQDWQRLGQLMTMQQGLLVAIGVSTPLLNHMIEKLEESALRGVKISGSGLGDCIVGLGSLSKFSFPDDRVKLMPVAISLQGVCCE